MLHAGKNQAEAKPALRFGLESPPPGPVGGGATSADPTGVAKGVGRQPRKAISITPSFLSRWFLLPPDYLIDPGSCLNSVFRRCRTGPGLWLGGTGRLVTCTSKFRLVHRLHTFTASVRPTITC